jgi:hypothetical protein
MKVRQVDDIVGSVLASPAQEVENTATSTTSDQTILIPTKHRESAMGCRREWSSMFGVGVPAPTF